MEASLVDSLQQKLDDLDRKVQAYRLERLAEFHQFYHQLLHDQSAAAVANVRRAIVPSLSSYDALRPDIDQTESRSSSMPNPAAFQPATLPSTASPPPSELHEREQEFQGLFTPSYLPLLDSRSGPTTSHPHVHTAAPTTAPAAGDNGTPMPPESDLTGRAVASARGNGSVASIDASGRRDEPSSESLITSQLPVRPSHARQSTDDTNASSVSDKSDGKIRRSALRRSPPPISPKRVRFEFKGLEVLPTASPQNSEVPTPRPSSPSSKQEQSVFASILGVDGEDDYEPPPKKVSSSEALRALSRTPLDEGTVWTVVNPDAEESSPSQPPKSSIVSGDALNEPKPPPKQTTTSSQAVEKVQTATTSQSVEQEAALNSESDQEESSDEEFLAMAKRKTSPKKSTVRSVPASAASSAAGAASGSIGPKISREPESTATLEEEKDQASSDDVNDDEDDDDMFHFEAGGLTPPPKPRARPRPPPLEENEDDDEFEDEPKGSDTSRQLASDKSPAVSISRSAGPEGPPTPTSAKFQAGSLGSYKGRSVIMPVVKDPELHAQAASLGEFHSFVGSLDGRSGMDEGDVSSFRASLVSPVYSGTPRSLTERMMMDDMEAHRRARKDEP